MSDDAYLPIGPPFIFLYRGSKILEEHRLIQVYKYFFLFSYYIVPQMATSLIQEVDLPLQKCLTLSFILILIIFQHQLSFNPFHTIPTFNDFEKEVF